MNTSEFIKCFQTWHNQLADNEFIKADQEMEYILACKKKLKDLAGIP